MMRFLVLFFAAAALFPSAAACAQRPLRVCAWVDYFPAWLQEEFTKETGIPVVQSFIADNRTLYRNLVEQKGIVYYDVITPSAEMLQLLASEGVLLPLDHEQIPNIKDSDPWFSVLAYDDGGIYSTPLFWGVLGIAVNTRLLAPELVARIRSYKDLWLPELKGKLLLPNDFRSLMSVMLLSLGRGVNDFDALPQAMLALESLSSSVRLFDTVDQLESMSAERATAGIVWVKKGYAEKDSGGRFRCVLAEEGSPLWIDTLAVPLDSGSPAAAFAFINFVLRPDILARLSESSGYAVAGRKARHLLPEGLRADTLVYPPDSLRERFEPEFMLPRSSDVLMKRWNTLRDGK